MITVNEKTNDIRSNLIFLMFKIYSKCQERQLSSCDWMQEGYSLSWDGKQALILRNSSVLAAVYEGQVNLEPSIQEYYHVPYSWLLSIKETLSDKR